MAFGCLILKVFARSSRSVGIGGCVYSLCTHCHPVATVREYNLNNPNTTHCYCLKKDRQFQGIIQFQERPSDEQYLYY